MKFTSAMSLFMGLYGLTSSIVNHYYINQYKTWTDAQQYCRLNYQDLSSVHSLKELQQLTVTANTSFTYWIGLYREAYDTQWKWSGGGQEEDFKQWDSGEPSWSPGHFCVTVKTVNSRYSAVECSALSTFFCMERYPDFILRQESRTWEGALHYCRMHYTNLASLLSDKEMLLATNISQQAKTTHIWTGLRFLVGQWFWVSKDPLIYQPWSDEDQAKCPAKNRCGALKKKSAVWDPIDCEEKHNFICF